VTVRLAADVLRKLLDVAMDFPKKGDVSTPTGGAGLTEFVRFSTSTESLKEYGALFGLVFPSPAVTCASGDNLPNYTRTTGEALPIAPGSAYVAMNFALKKGFRSAFVLNTRAGEPFNITAGSDNNGEATA
jgi:hypothetical protein